MRRTAQRARRSSLTEKEREQILENRRSTYQMKRRKVGDATNNEGRAGTSSGMESDRGKRVRNDQEAGPSRIGGILQQQLFVTKNRSSGQKCLTTSFSATIVGGRL
ncbi:hypothetical protein MKW98_026757 [Papaver atlanticum]|uniref:Uncharacterized protein n=1 Tax=Papaver atlanticum TaxID=357466 RepID=A0AAD4X5F8_9MAGN|nr:hypothetical protein MKW98_026757 [Papaver atlanticum]